MYKFPGMGIVVGTGTAQGLAVTGFDYAWWIFFGMVMLIAGAFLFRVAQRRGRHTHASARPQQS
ncbi:peptidase [Qaidamihabitans albus]|uniref:peptidase n=1 Tax=Qaidamihabitans albus TaxID=2795733 RepID=UPI0018F23341|nr:peptidase [Qaidamihabitans albus]